MPCLRNSYHKEIILKGDPKHAICKTFKKARHNNDSDFCDRWGINWGLNHTDIKFRNILVAKSPFSVILMLRKKIKANDLYSGLSTIHLNFVILLSFIITIIVREMEWIFFIFIHYHKMYFASIISLDCSNCILKQGLF